MKQVRYGVAFIAAISAFTVGCVSTRTTQVDSRTSAWRGKSVALTNRPPAGFAPVTAGKMMFGLIGAAAMVEAGRRLVAENSLEDPAPIVGRSLQQAAMAHYGTVDSANPPTSIDETDILKLAQAARGADLLLFLRGRRIGIEIKRADAPTMTPSMISALKDLELHRLLVVYPGATRYKLRSKVEVMSLAECMAELDHSHRE